MTKKSQSQREEKQVRVVLVVCFSNMQGNKKQLGPSSTNARKQLKCEEGKRLSQVSLSQTREEPTN